MDLQHFQKHKYCFKRQEKKSASIINADHGYHYCHSYSWSEYIICTLQTSERKGMLLITMFQGRHSDTHPLIQLARVTWAQEPATSTKTTTKGTEKIIPMQDPWLSTQIVHMYCDIQKALPRDKVLEFNLNLLQFWLINFKQKVNMVKNIFTVENVGLRLILDYGLYLALAHFNCKMTSHTDIASSISW